MARLEKSTCSQKLQAILRLAAGGSYRDASRASNIPKSTLHDNHEKFINMLHHATEDGQIEARKFLVRATLIMCLTCKSSARDCAQAISSLFSASISHQTVLRILSLSASIAKRIQSNVPLTEIESIACDEIFQRSQPILGVIDLNSSYAMLKHTTDRRAESWAQHLDSLKTQGLNPKSATSDAGQGMIKGLNTAFPGIALIRDLFHVLRKLSKAIRKMEGTCYALIDQVDKHGDDIELRKKQDLAIEQFDIICDLVSRLRQAAYLTDPEGPSAPEADLGALLDQTCNALELFESKVSRSHVVHQALTYLRNGKGEILAYKAEIDRHCLACFGEQHKHLAQKYLMPIAERISQYQAAYENNKKSERLGREIAYLRSSLRSSPFCQDEVDKAINMAFEIYNKTHKASSLIECVNSVIRRHLNSYKSIPSWFPDLFTYHWNFRRFNRGKRKNYAPIELMTCQAIKGDWLELILDEFPYDKLRKRVNVAAVPLAPAA